MINLKKIFIMSFLVGSSTLIYYIKNIDTPSETLNFDEDIDLFNDNLSWLMIEKKNNVLNKDEWHKKYDGKRLNDEELSKLYSKLSQPKIMGNNWVSLSSLKTFCNNKHQIGEGLYETFEYLCTKLSTLYSD